MAGVKETKKTAEAPKGKTKRKDEPKEESERPKKAAKAEKPPAKAKPEPKGKAKKADEGGKAKKEKKVKDPNAPKKNLTAFMYFSNATRDKVKSDNPGIAFGDVGKVLGERWKALSAEDKTEYEDMAKKDKERYTKAIEAYKGGEAAAPAAKPKAKAKPAPAKKAAEEEEDDDEDDGDDGGSDDEEDVDDEDE